MRFQHNENQYAESSLNLSKFGELKGTYHCSLSNIDSNKIISLVILGSMSALFGYLFFYTISRFINFAQYERGFYFVIEIIALVAEIVIGLSAVSAFLFAVWILFRGFKDEMKIYANGFTYKSRKGLQSSLWSEIKELFGDSAVKKNREKIKIATLMTGVKTLLDSYDGILVDEINEAEDRERVHNIVKTESAKPQTLGEFQKTYTSRQRFAYLFYGVFVFITGFVPIASLGVLYEKGISVAGIIVALIFSLPFVACVFMLKNLFAERKDKLHIYENGFAYESCKGLQNCLWHEIKEWDTGKGNIIRGVRKNSGEYISFAGWVDDDETTRKKLREYRGF